VNNSSGESEILRSTLFHRFNVAGQSPWTSIQEYSTQTKYNSKNANNANTAKQNYPVSVASYNTRSGNEMGLFCIDCKPDISQVIGCEDLL